MSVPRCLATPTCRPPADTARSSRTTSCGITRTTGHTAGRCARRRNTAPRPTRNERSLSSTSTSARSNSAAAPALRHTLRHEYACIHCPMLDLDPAMLHRLDDLETDLLTRHHEARRRGWLGATDGTDTTLDQL